VKKKIVKEEKKGNIKKVVLVIGIVVAVLLLTGVITFEVLLQPVSKENDIVVFVIEPKTSKIDIIKNLKSSNIIKNENAAIIYTALHRLKLQAGEYALNRGESTKEILGKISKGIIKEPDTISVTFVEGKRITDYAKVISDKFGYKYDDVMAVFKDKDYAQELMNKYSFLSSDILSSEIYYPLEGYLFPSTYSFYENASIKDIIEKLLKETGNKLNSLKQSIDDNNLDTHSLLTMASIVESEGTNATNRAQIAQVINKRISIGMNLGMDVTTYYAVQKEMKEPLTKKDLASTSKYNTRLSTNLGLPIGPICNPSLESITAVLNPSQTNYLYFYASKDGTIKFTDSYEEFMVFKRNG
jgi:UPF0755 protein